MPWNDHGIQTGHAALLFQSCRSLALMDLLLISKLQAFHCCNKNGQPNSALSRVQSHPCRFWRIVVASRLLEWSKPGDLFLKKWWLIYFCRCDYIFTILGEYICVYQKLGKLMSNKPHGAALQNLQLSHCRCGSRTGRHMEVRWVGKSRDFHSQRA